MTRVLVGDCRDVLATLAAGSVSAVVTDPPYGLSFMGKGWDHGVPGVEFWTATMRVMAPGAYLLAFGGTRTYHRLTCAIEDAGFDIQDCLCWLYGSGFPKHKSKLKPAWEPILLAHKPAKRAVPLNIEACRIEANEPIAAHHSTNNPRVAMGTGWHDAYKAGDAGKIVQTGGRWPANVVLDEEAAAALDEQSGVSTSPDTPVRQGGNHRHDVGLANTGTRQGFGTGFGDTGGASRFFFTAKAPRSEREAGLDTLPAHERQAFEGSMDSLTDLRMGHQQKRRPARNNHPTVKPLDLMQWLCRLVTPPGGLILDPFCGSGTTGCAALMEGFEFVGIERDPEYAAIAEKRLAHWGQQIAMPLIAEGA